ncbi:ABC transporter permease [Xylanimonas ulmi]|uniref:Putative spermidine/putrescine transport system permease protein n=1 Tax=Xylanimonas ulmi TaxID=228973 RepID=A0A4Q7M6Q1_9MICO|nr:ABC transporter permease subunit [Xylanibacterium ulmi]RZS61759.1 putative spermidine/putrescine transport system permease protein [Xylanibacterium ulmi]
MRRGLGPGPATRTAIALVVGAVFLVPIASMVEFTLRDGDGHSLVHWATLFDPAGAGKYAPIREGLVNSLVLAAVTVAIVLLLLAPTMVLVTLRLPHLRRPFELLALLPVSLPAIVLVVGLAPIYRVIGQTIGTGVWSLALAYGVTALPYAHRSIQAAIDAIGVRTLAEAARTLGSGWPTVLLRVLAPNLRGGLLTASLISVAVVLGEFTIASLLARQNLQTALFVVNRQDPYVAVILSLLALALVFVLLLAIGRAGARGSGARPEGS